MRYREPAGPRSAQSRVQLMRRLRTEAISTQPPPILLNRVISRSKAGPSIRCANLDRLSMDGAHLRLHLHRHRCLLAVIFQVTTYLRIGLLIRQIAFRRQTQLHSLRREFSRGKVARHNKLYTIGELQSTGALLGTGSYQVTRLGDRQIIIRNLPSVRNSKTLTAVAKIVVRRSEEQPVRGRSCLPCVCSLIFAASGLPRFS